MPLEDRKAYMRAWVRRAKALAKARAWAKAYPERVRAAVRKWQAANREKARSATRAWMLANPEKVRLASANRRAMRRGQPSVALEDIKTLWDSYCGLCVYCLAPAEHTDHVVPLSRGGAHHIGNLVPACAACNISKRDRPLFVWMARRRMSEIRGD